MTISPTFVFAYLLGGLTFLPLVVIAIFCYSYVTLPTWSKSSLAGPDDLTALNDANESLKEKLTSSNHEPDVAAGYFAVCREYVPRGLNGKPPERNTPAGEVIAAESPSVYQSMYRSIFDRGKTQTPSFEGGKAVKKGRNVFYVVLRHNHLMLFDTADQLEVRHVIALVHYEIDIYGGGEKIPEGELHIKKNCIRLTKKPTIGDITPTSLPFFLFSDNCSEKEDFYHAILHSQERKPGSPNNPPTTLMFDTEDMISLVRQLHTTEENLQTRWLNALVGRIFLALYKTSNVETRMRNKINRKISRVSKPTFIKTLRLDEVVMGHSAPVFSNLKLKDMTVDGGLTLETTVKYNGNFRIVLAAIARLDLGSRFKAREVDLVLSGVLRKLEGHLLVRVKPPPSNRIWVSFETMPKLDISFEPIVSSRQVTYGVILRAIESKVREIVLETLVYPNWDDIPFTDTEGQRFRGGIWQDDEAVRPLIDQETRSSRKIHADHLYEPSENALDGTVEEGPSTENASMPDLSKSVKRERRSSIASTSYSVDESGEVRSSSQPRTPPKAMRSNSFATIASPVVNTGSARGDSILKQVKKGHHDASTKMKMLSIRSHDNSPASSPSTPVAQSPTPGTPTMEDGKQNGKDRSLSMPFAGQPLDDSGISKSNSILGDFSNGDFDLMAEPEPVSRTNSITQSQYNPLSSTSNAIPTDKKHAIEQSISTATAAAKKWGIGVFQRRGGDSRTHERKTSESAEEFSASPNRFYGRGRPLPPPGVPLPKPDKEGWSAAAFGSIKKKPVPTSSHPASLQGAVQHQPKPQGMSDNNPGTSFETDERARSASQSSSIVESEPSLVQQDPLATGSDEMGNLDNSGNVSCDDTNYVEKIPSLLGDNGVLSEQAQETTPSLSRDNEKSEITDRRRSDSDIFQHRIHELESS